MPRRAIGTAIHDDTGHTGSAKRDTNGGVAGLFPNGALMAKGASVLLTRDGNDDVGIVERTSSEQVIIARRSGANAYTLYNNTVAGAKVIQDSSMKGVANGIAALDASGNVLVPAASIQLTRDGGNLIYITERSSGEFVCGMKRIGTTSYYQTFNRSGAGQIVPTLDANGDIPHMRPKAASANARHTYATETTFGAGGGFLVRHRFTFANGISGVLRISFDLKNGDGGGTTYGQIYKNDVALGTVQSVLGTVYATKTEDINVGVLAPGDNLALYAYSTVSTGYFKNLILAYDNAADTVLVAGVTESGV